LATPTATRAVAVIERLAPPRLHLLTVVPREHGRVISRTSLIAGTSTAWISGRDETVRLGDAPPTRVRSSPPIECLELEDVVTTGTGTVRSEGLLLGNVDVLESLSLGARLKGVGVRLHVGQEVLFEEPRSIASLPAGILLCGFGGANWYHWLIETLPRLALSARLSGDLSTLPLVVPSRALRVPAARATLDLMSRDREIVPVGRTDFLRIGRAVWIDPPTLGPRSYRNGMWPRPDHAAVNAPALVDVRRRLLASVSFDARSTPKRVLLVRDSRNARNVDESSIRDHAEARGFQAIDPGGLSLSEQIALFAGADTVVGAWGAAWANTLFASEGSRGLMLAPEPFAGWSIFSNIAAVVGMDQRVLLGRTSASTFADANRTPFLIDADEFADAIHTLLAA
jgi:capsular polysaccharide biosynthesis protein